MPISSAQRPELQQQMQELYAAREAFIQFGQVLPTVRPVVWDSWRRCQALGVNPRKVAPQKRDPEKLARARAESRALYEAAEPILQAANEALRDLPHILVLLDRHAVLLRLLADPVAEKLATEEANLYEGASWDERDLGCNGGGTSLAIGQPVILIGPEHLVEDYVGWTCIGVPIHGPDGAVAGTLDLSVPNERVRVHTWGWILRVARAIEEALAGAKPGRDAVEALGDIYNPLHAAHGVLKLLAQQVELTPLQRYFLEEAGAQVEEAERRYQGEEAALRLQETVNQLQSVVAQLMGAQGRQKPKQGEPPRMHS